MRKKYQNWHHDIWFNDTQHMTMTFY